MELLETEGRDRGKWGREEGMVGSEESVDFETNLNPNLILTLW